MDDSTDPQNTQPGDNYLDNQFLVSMPQLEDPNFSRTVILVCKHDESGAVGIVINRHTDHSIGEIFEQLDINATSQTFTSNPVLEGGPVYPELGLVVHNGTRGTWESSISIDEDLYLTSSRDILNDMASGKGPESALLSLGYAGWGPGQLESEIQANSWLTTPVDQQILFSPDVENKWQLSAQLIGIDISQISSQFGHA